MIEYRDIDEAPFVWFGHTEDGFEIFVDQEGLKLVLTCEGGSPNTEAVLGYIASSQEALHKLKYRFLED